MQLTHFDSACRQHESGKKGSMFLILAIVLVILWVGGFVVYHTAGFLIHLLLIFAVISVIIHFLRGGKSTT
jgi:hypothetical protein